MFKKNNNLTTTWKIKPPMPYNSIILVLILKELQTALKIASFKKLHTKYYHKSIQKLKKNGNVSIFLVRSVYYKQSFYF